MRMIRLHEIIKVNKPVNCTCDYIIKEDEEIIIEAVKNKRRHEYYIKIGECLDTSIIKKGMSINELV